MKKQLLYSWLLAMLFCITGASNAWGVEITFTPGTDTGATSVNKGNVSATMTTMDNSSYYQIYANKSALFTCINGTITKIEFTCTASGTSKYGPGNASASVGSYSYSGNKGTWTGSATDITISSTAQVRMTSLVITYEPTASSYTITATSNNDNYGTVSGTTTITASPSSGYRVVAGDGGYTVTNGTATVTNNGDNTFSVTPSTDCTVQINFEAIPTYTVTYSDGGFVTEASAGAGVTLATRTNIGSYTFAGWSVANVPTETTTAPTIISTSETYYPSENIILYPVYTKTEGGGGITHKSTSVTIADYAEDNSWENGIAYQPLEMDANISVGGTISGNNFKYYTSDNSWRFYAGGSFTISAKNSATLTSVILTNLAGTLKYGDETITSGTAFDVSGNSATISCTANSKITAISVKYDITGGGTTYYWSAPVAAAVETPVIAVADNPFLFSTTATITCATEGATIKYSYDNSAWNDYSTALTITETKTIYAKATKNENESSVAQVTATKNLAEPTVTVSGDLTLDLDGGTNVSAGTLTATVTYNSTAVEGATVTWSGNNDAVATIDASTGAVTIKTTGSVTFTANYAGNGDYAAATGTKTVTVVDSNAPGTTQQNPYTVAQALTAIQALPDNNATSEKYYVSGIVSAFYGDATGITSSSSKRYYISDDGTTTTQLLVFNGKGLDDVNFSSDDDLLIGDRVIIYGAIQNYQGNTPEMASGNYIVNRTTKTANDLTKTNDISLSMANPSVTATATDYFTTSSTGDLSYEIADESVATVNAGVVTPVAAGTTTLTVSQAADATYKAGSLEITVTVAAASLNETTIYASASGSTTYGTNKEEDYLIDDTYDGTVVAVSSNTSVATVTITQHTSGEGTFTITPVAVGTAVITISAPATATCEAADDVTYTITVNAPTGGTKAAESGFVKVTATEDITGGEYLIVYEDGNLAFDGSSDGLDAVGNTIEVGIENNKIAADATTTASTFTIAAVTGGYSIQSKSGYYIGQTSDANGLATSDETAYTNTLSITDGDADIVSSSAYLRYNSASNQNRFRYYKSSSYTGQKAIQLYKLAGADITVTLNAYGYATFCSEYPLDFTTTEGYTAWRVSNMATDGTITFKKITEPIKGGQGILLKGEANATVTLTSANSDNILSENKLVGTTAPTYVTTVNGSNTNFGLSGSTFVKINSGTVKAGKAYLPIPNSIVENYSAGARLTFIFEDGETTGIESLTPALSNSEGAQAVYDLQGRKVSKPSRGLYIVNGKKVVIK